MLVKSYFKIISKTVTGLMFGLVNTIILFFFIINYLFYRDSPHSMAERCFYPFPVYTCVIRVALHSTTVSG